MVVRSEKRAVYYALKDKAMAYGQDLSGWVGQNEAKKSKVSGKIRKMDQNLRNLRKKN